MVKPLIRRRVRKVFAALGRNDFDFVLGLVSRDVHHRFSGTTAISGDRHGRDALARWFERFARLFPRHDFTLHRIVVDGPPWDLVVAARWSVDIEPAAGEAYGTEGTHWLRIRRGKVTELTGVADTAPAERALEAMAAAGVDEAAAQPLH